MARDAGSSRRAYLTTHQVARLLGVSLPTVVNWIEAGRISAHRTPGGHRRIRREELIRFSDAFSYPLPIEFLAEAGPARVLIADPDPDLGELLQDFLAMRGGYKVRLAQTAFDVGYLLGAFQPQVVMIDLSMPGLDAARVLKVIREGVQARVYACSALHDAGAMPLLEQFDGIIEKPFRWEQLYETLRRAAS